MRIQHNILSMNAYRNYTNNTSALGKNLEKLSSGYKINRAGDDAAGLAISEKMRAQIKGLDAAQKNVKDSISFVKTAEGAMQEIQDMLSRMKYLATQSANGTYEDKVDRKALQDEVDSLLEEINRIAQSANFNDIHMLNGPETPGAGDDSGLTAADITAPTATTATFTDITGGNAAKVEFNFAGVAFKADGNVKVSYGNKEYTVAVKKDMSAKDFAAAFVTEYNKDQIDDTGAAGKFTAAVDGTTDTKVVFTGTATTGTTTASLATELAKAPVIAPAEAAKATGRAADDAAETTYGKGAKIEYDLSALTTQPTANQTLKIGTKTYTFVANGTTPTADQIEIGADIGATLGNIATEIKKGTDFDAAYDSTAKTLTLTTKQDYDDKAAFDAATAIDGTWAAAKTEMTKTDNVTVTPADNGDGDGEGGGKTGNFTKSFQIGDSSAGYDTMDISIQSMSTDSLAISGLSIATLDDAHDAIDTIKTAINTVSSVRGQLGAYQNRLEHTANNLSVMHENIQDAESTIRDTDVADEMMAYTKNNILIQSAQAMLAQANAVPQGVLQLLQ